MTNYVFMSLFPRDFWGGITSAYYFDKKPGVVENSFLSS